MACNIFLNLRCAIAYYCQDAEPDLHFQANRIAASKAKMTMTSLLIAKKMMAAFYKVEILSALLAHIRASRHHLFAKFVEMH